MALAIQRSTFFGEADSVKTFLITSRNEVTDPDSFFEAFNDLTGTFNWLYVDADNIAYFNSSLLPDRADGIHPDLPQWGTGEFDWQQTGTGFGNPDFSFDNLPASREPSARNESGLWLLRQLEQRTGSGVLRQRWADLLGSDLPFGHAEARLQAYRAQDGNPLHTRASMVEAMIDAGTTDLRGEVILPAVFAVLGDVSDLDAVRAGTRSTHEGLGRSWAKRPRLQCVAIATARAWTARRSSTRTIPPWRSWMPGGTT